jgi:hypothetical protein
VGQARGEELDEGIREAPQPPPLEQGNPGGVAAKQMAGVEHAKVDVAARIERHGGDDPHP